MMQWETLIHETVQLGGNLVFLSDDTPENFDGWIQPLLEIFRFEIPVVKRRVGDLLHKKFSTSPLDLICVFASQKKHIIALNSVLQGQRVLISDVELSEKEEILDFVWAPCSLTVWMQMLYQLQRKWSHLSTLVEIKDSHEGPCLFLDRDDVVVKNIPYNNDPGKVELIPGIEKLISLAHAKGYWVSLVTNQSGLGRGWVSWLEYQKVHQRMLQLLVQKGCWIDECVWAAYIDEESVPYGHLFAGLRKPRSGMFQMVNTKLQVNMGQSLMVGDSASDLIAAFGAGVGRLCLFQSEKIEKERNQLIQYQQKNNSFSFETVTDLSNMML